MAVRTVKLQALDGSPVEFVDDSPKQGGMKDVFFAPDRSYVVAFFRKPLDGAGRERLDKLVGDYSRGIFQQAGGDYWRQLYRWPERILEHKGLTGLVVPIYEKHFYFGAHTMLAGGEKEGKWFASAKNLNRFVPAEEKGTLLGYLRICLLLSRAVRRLHLAGLAHSDLSYKNCLIDPAGMNACIIDIDGLVVPGVYPPDVIGTPDFIAPEVVATGRLSLNDPAKRLPRRETDQHALAVLIYMYLLHRHPLRGSKVHDLDDQRQEELEMGSAALFIEHPANGSNRPKFGEGHEAFMPWADPGKIPYTACGPYLKKLFDQAFINGLHDPSRRPTADDWECELVKTCDLIQPCQNEKCVKKWFVFDNTTRPRCPYCGVEFKGILPILNLYSSRNGVDFRPDNHRIMVYSNQYLFQWHVDRTVFPNERTTAEQSRPAGYFAFHQGKWLFVNQTLTELENLLTKERIAPGAAVELRDGLQLQLSKAATGRIAQVQLVRN